jgi:membrane protease YdiL (CAAX protease family)
MLIPAEPATLQASKGDEKGLENVAKNRKRIPPRPFHATEIGYAAVAEDSSRVSFAFVHPVRSFSEAARPYDEWWRFALGIFVLYLLSFLFILLGNLGLRAIILVPPTIETWGAEAVNAIRMPLFPPGSAAASLLVLGMFITQWPALWVMLRVVHLRRLTTLFGPTGRINWRHFRIGLAVSLGIGGIAWAPTLFGNGMEAFTPADLNRWAPMLLLGVPLLFVQVASEEMVFRGYMLQQFAAKFWTPLGWSIVPSVLFALSHSADNTVLGISWFHFVFGMIMAAVTSRTANLGAAIGLHLGHNIINILIVSGQSKVINGLALFAVAPETDTGLSNYIYIALMFVSVMAFIFMRDRVFIREWRRAKALRAAQNIH